MQTELWVDCSDYDSLVQGEQVVARSAGPENFQRRGLALVKVILSDEEFEIRLQPASNEKGVITLEPREIALFLVRRVLP